MLFKSKSVITIIGLALVGLITFGVGAYILRTPATREFVLDGYILTAEAGDEESITVSRQFWFGQGKSWSDNSEGIQFAGAEGEKLTLPNDSFIHYTDGSISTFKNTAVMNLDDYLEGIIQYYGMTCDDILSYQGNSFQLGEGENAIGFSNFLMKSSDNRYILGSPSMNLVQAAAGRGEQIDTGYVEIEYLSDDKSVVLVNDSVRAWQFLSQGAYIELANGVRLNLETGELERAAAAGTGQETDAFSRFFIDDVDVDVNLDITAMEMAGGSDFTYPTYRFTVINGKDGEDGEDGRAGETGTEGTEGETGQEGESGGGDNDGSDGASGSTGLTGNTAQTGYSGDQISGVKVVTSIPTVTLKDWVVNGKALKFTVCVDEESYDSITEGTTYISLVDTSTDQEVYYWSSDGDKGSTGQSVDLSEETSDGHTLYCSALEAGHQYRFTVYAEYTVNDVTGSQALLSRTFTADDYGISYELLERTNNKLVFALKQSDSLVEVENVEVLVNGVSYGTMSSADFERYEINLAEDDPSVNHSNQTYEITFRTALYVTSFDNEGEMVRVMIGDDEEPAIYTYTVTTLKKAPSVGGVRLTAYNSGHFLAEMLGEWDGSNSYKAVVDEDDAITEIVFELYDTPIYTEEFRSLSEVEQQKHLAASQTVKDGYISYFTVSEDTSEPVHVNERYYLKAYYTYNDGEKEVKLPVVETWGRTSIDDNDQDIFHTERQFAWDTAKLASITKTTLKFQGDGETYNTVEEATEGIDSGITFNAIQGFVTAEINANNSYWISSAHPMELQISAGPDYYRSIKYSGVSNDAEGTLQVMQAGASSTDVSLAGKSLLKMNVDLTGLKANTSYMFTLYGYAAAPVQAGETQTFSRMTLGSLVVTTKSEMPFKASLTGDGSDSSIGCWFMLGDFQAGEDAANYYDMNTGMYTGDYKANTDASYRGLAALEFALYREGSAEPIGTCMIQNESDKGVDYNDLYERFYGNNASKTRTLYVNQGYKGVIGVGKDYYPYYFVDEAGLEIQPGTLTNGKYRISLTAAYDYTYTRYHYMDQNPESTLYDYYTYKAAEGEYINKLNTSVFTSLPLENVTLPYIVPGRELMDENGDYITVTSIKNSEAGKYNGDDDQNALYCSLWDEDIVAGLKLNCRYRNDADLQTGSFYYYGFAYETYDDITPSEQPMETPESTDPYYGFRCTIDLGSNEYMTVPEVWLLFYDEESIPTLDSLATEGKIVEINKSSGDMGYKYYRSAKVNGKQVEIYYMDASFFRRGYSYVFGYEAELPEYTYKTAEGDSKTGFCYPESYYTDIQGYNYNKTNALTSSTVSVSRQKPVVYASLESTGQGNGDNSGMDTWKVYVDDPDGAIRWDSILRASENNHVQGGSSRQDHGGIYDLFGNTIPAIEGKTDEKEGKYLTFDISSENVDGGTNTINTRTVFNDGSLDAEQDQEEFLNSKTAQELEHIAECLSSAKRVGDDIVGRGGSIKVRNLKDLGMSYKLTADYILLEDYGFNANTSYENISIVEHNYTGYSNYDAGNEKDRLTFKLDSSYADHNTMFVYLEASENDKDASTIDSNTDKYYLSDAYLQKARGIAAVSVQAYKQVGGQKVYIYERNADTGIPDSKKPKTLWLYPNAPASTSTSDYRYYLRFKLSDFDNTDREDIQYKPSDILGFEMTIHYATGDSAAGLLEDYYSEDTYVVKYVNDIADNKLYGSGERADAAKYLYTSSGSVSGSYSGAGRSFYKVKLTKNVDAALPWTQTYSIQSDTFDASACRDKNLDKVILSNASGYYGKTVLEALKVKTYTVGAGNEEWATVQVQSAAPALSNLKATGGIATVNLSGTVDNWNLVEYPGDDPLRLYYLVYTYNDSSNNKGNLVAAMVGEQTDLISAKGQLDVDLMLETGSKYWIEIYYKDKAAAEDHSPGSFDNLTDDKLFTNCQVGRIYKDTDATTVANVITTNDSQAFKHITGLTDDRVLAQTGTGLSVSSVALELGNTEAYDSKRLGVTTRITTDILENERESLHIFYRLERCSETDSASVESNWKTVIADKNDTGVANWYSKPLEDTSPCYWQYYDSGTNGKDITLDPVYVRKGKNDMFMRYFAGGQIVPGYSYRIQAAVYQEVNGSYTLVSTKDADHPDGWVKSAAVSWKTLPVNEDTTALLQVANVSRSGQAIRLSYKVRDTNYTSLDGYYFVRLAEKQPDGTYKVLEGSENAELYKNEGRENWMNKAFAMGETYAAAYGTNSTMHLKGDTTYRLQFYALMDQNYDNHLNVSESDNALLTKEYMDNSGSLVDIMDLRTYYPREKGRENIEDNYSAFYDTFYEGFRRTNGTPSVPASLSLEADKAIMIGYSDDITTMSSGITSSAGSFQNVVIGDAHLITLKFTGAFNAGDISRITYSLVEESGAHSWDAVTVYKGEGEQSFFDETGTGVMGTGTDGNISLRLELGDVKDANSMNVGTAGEKYYLSIRFETYSQSGGYETVGNYAIRFKNTSGN